MPWSLTGRCRSCTDSDRLGVMFLLHQDEGDGCLYSGANSEQTALMATNSELTIFSAQYVYVTPIGLLIKCECQHNTQVLQSLITYKIYL